MSEDPNDDPVDPLADPQRQQEAMDRARKAQERMLSPQFGNHTFTHGDDGGKPGEGGQKSRIQELVDGAVDGTVERTASEIDRVIEAMREIAQEIVVSPGELEAMQQTGAAQQMPSWDVRDERPPAVAADWSSGATSDRDAITSPPTDWTEPVSFTAAAEPWAPPAAPWPGGPAGEPSRPFEPVVGSVQPPVAALHQMAPQAREIQEIHSGHAVVQQAAEKPSMPEDYSPEMSTIVDKTESPSGPMPWQTGDQWKTPPHHAFELEPGADSAAQPFTGSQHRQREQMIDLGGAIDDFGIEMAEFTEAVTDAIRTLTRRVNDMSRALQGEGRDFF